MIVDIVVVMAVVSWIGLGCWIGVDFFVEVVVGGSCSCV